MIAQAADKHKQEKVAIILIAKRFWMASAAALAILQEKYIL